MSTHSPQIRGVFGHGDTFTEALEDWRQAAHLYRETFGALGLVDNDCATPDAIEVETVTV